MTAGDGRYRLPPSHLQKGAHVSDAHTTPTTSNDGAEPRMPLRGQAGLAVCRVEEVARVLTRRYYEI